MARNIIEFRLGRGELRDFERGLEGQGWMIEPHTLVWKDTLGAVKLGDEGDILWEAEVVPDGFPQ